MITQTISAGLEEVGYIHSTQVQLCSPLVIINQMRLQACYRHRTLLTNILMIANLKLKKQFILHMSIIKINLCQRFMNFYQSKI